MPNSSHAPTMDSGLATIMKCLKFLIQSVLNSLFKSAILDFFSLTKSSYTALDKEFTVELLNYE